MRPTRLLPLLAGCVLVATRPASATPTPQGQPRPNVLILLADDFGIDQLGLYNPAGSMPPPNTPNIDTLAAEGVRFTNAYSAPLCSPSRACLMTGRYGFRTGIGTNVRSNNTATALGPMSVSEITLPEMLNAGGSGYTHVAIGKWHLGYHQFLAIAGNALNNGFEHFAGTKGNFETRSLPPQSYNLWSKTVDGFTQTTSTFSTVDNVDEALAFTTSQGTQPWLCYVAFNAPHVPLVRPPGFALPHAAPVAGEAWWPYQRAMIEHLDSEIGRLLSTLRAQSPVAYERTLVLFMGDNGTGGGDSGPAQLVFPPFDPMRAKGTVFEGGVHVPLIASGRMIDHPGRTSDALVHLVDVFATVAGVAKVDLGDPAVIPAGRTIDSVSFWPVLTSASVLGARQHLFCEVFSANNPQPGAALAPRRSLRDERYKLIRDEALPAGQTVQFFDLVSDPFEYNDLLTQAGGLSPAQQSAFTNLSAALDALLASP
jgi:arylsulfatase B